MSMRAVGPYQPIEELDEGQGYATYRAIDPRLFGQPIALTVAAISGGASEFTQRFEAGATKLTGLRHPNILPVIDFGETLEQVYLVTPYLEGPTLASVIGQPRRPVEALSLIATLGEALDHAHRQGLPHGDLTPAAIQLANLPPGEDTLFAAWPIVRYHGFAPLIGTAEPQSPYRAPESTAEGSSSADLYALAAILHTLLLGTPPNGEDIEAADRLPDGMAATLRRALATDPESRYATAADFLLALREASAIARRNEEREAGGLLNEARGAVAAGKLRAASEAYSAYLLLRPQDEMAQREFATIESRRAEVARRRAEAAKARATIAPAQPTPETTPTTTTTTTAPTTPAPVPRARDTEEGWDDTPDADTAGETSTGRFELRNLLPFGTGQAGSAHGPSLGPGGLGTTRQAARGVTPRDFKPIAAPARLRRQAVLPIVIITAIFILILASGGLLVARQRASGAANATATRVASTAVARGSQAAGATRTPSRIAPNVPPVIPVAPTIPPLTPTPVPTLPPLAPVFNDTFGDPNTGFPREPGGFVDAGYQAGEYILRVPQPDGFEIAELNGCVLPGVPDCIFGDMVLEVDMRAVGAAAGGSYGLVFHRQFVGAYIQYFVLIDPEAGTVRLVRWNDSDRVELIPPTPIAQIGKGEATNHLEIAVKGRTITVSVNGATLPTINDAAGPPFGVVAMRADAGTTPIEVRFDNFIIRPIR